MTPEELIEILKEYDFKNNSVKKFSREYNICEKTIVKYLRNNNIQYSNRVIKSNIPRDSLGRFKLVEQNCKIDNVTNFSEFSNKYRNYF